MANNGTLWVVTDNTLKTLQGGTVAEDTTVTLEITNMITDDNGFSLWSGYKLAAENFKVGGGVETDGNGIVLDPTSSTYVATNIWEPTGGAIWNANENIKKVTFKDKKLAGDADNTVEVELVLKSFSIAGDAASSLNMYVDIDEKTDKPVTDSSNAFVCLTVTDQANDTNSTVTYSTPYADVTGTATGLTYKASGTIPDDGRPYEILEFTVSANSGYYFSERDFASFTQPAGRYVDYSGYTVRLESINRNADRQAISLVYKVHSNPKTAGYNIQSLNDLCDLNHSMSHLFTAKQIPVINTTHRISDVRYPEIISSEGGKVTISVLGSSEAPFGISFEKKTGVNSIVTAATNGYYNTKTNSFQNDKFIHYTKTNERGYCSVRVEVPSVTSVTRYDIVVHAAQEDGSITELATRVPTQAGQAIIKQSGVNCITLKPITRNTTSNFGSLSGIQTTICRRDNFLGKNPIRIKEETFEVTGNTGGGSSTIFFIERKNIEHSVEAGMFVIGDNVTHGTTVSHVKGNAVVFNTASNLANGSKVKFIRDTGRMYSFSFTITPGAGKTLNVNNSAIPIEKVGGFKSKDAKTTTVTSKTATITLASTKGIVAGMKVFGADVKHPSENQSVRVSSVTSETVVVLDTPQSFRSGINLTFGGGNTKANAKIKSIGVAKVGDNIVVSGFVNASDLLVTSDAEIYIDDLITVT
jgi:hypothetical protein